MQTTLKSMNEVFIRGLEARDWEDIAEIFLSPRCQWGTLQLPYQSRDRVRQRTEQIAKEGNSLVAVVGGKVIGTIGLEIQGGRRSHVGAIGMSVHDQYQGQKFGSKLLEAMLNLTDNWLNIRRLELQVYCDNEPAIALYQKFGFTIEGTLRQFAFRDGVYVDAYAMARLRSLPA